MLSESELNNEGANMHNLNTETVKVINTINTGYADIKNHVINCSKEPTINDSMFGLIIQYILPTVRYTDVDYKSIRQYFNQ